MNLYQIDNEILSCVDAETGEILDVEKLEQLQMERDAKLEGVACWYKDLVADAAKIRDEEKNLAEGAGEQGGRLEAVSERRTAGPEVPDVQVCCQLSEHVKRGADRACTGHRVGADPRPR